jgi:predicted RNA-binding protein YlqC (UPF0109 family)
MSEITVDQQFIEYIAKSLVDNEQDVSVERVVDERGVLLTLFVNPADLGRVIGKRGAIAESMRTLLRSLGIKNNAHYNLKIADTDGGGSESSSSSEQFERTQQSSQNSHPKPNYRQRINDKEDFIVENSGKDYEELTEKNESEESDFIKNTRQELADLED